MCGDTTLFCFPLGKLAMLPQTPMLLALTPLLLEDNWSSNPRVHYVSLSGHRPWSAAELPHSLSLGDEFDVLGSLSFLECKGGGEHRASALEASGLEV